MWPQNHDPFSGMALSMLAAAIGTAALSGIAGLFHVKAHQSGFRTAE
jgi:uncharacterized membrane protein